VVSGVRRMNKVNPHQARLVPGWLTVFFVRVYHLSKNQPTRSNQPCTPGVAKSSARFGGDKGRNVTSVGWQVTLYDPVWHVSWQTCELLYTCYLLYCRDLLLVRNDHLCSITVHYYGRSASPLLPT